jgi:hypothetical protein
LLLFVSPSLILLLSLSQDKQTQHTTQFFPLPARIKAISQNFGYEIKDLNTGRDGGIIMTLLVII